MRRIPKDAAAILEYARSLPDIRRIDVGHISLKFNLNFKATCLLLEAAHLIPDGIYDEFCMRGIKVARVYEYARAEYGE